MAHEREPQTPEESPPDLTPALGTARRGFRRDTEPLTSQLDTALVYVAMAEPVQDDDDELRIVPQLTQTDGGQVLFPVFTSAERLREFAARLGWSTEGDELSYCSLSLRSGFDVLIDLAAEDHVEAMVIDPAEEHELLLRPNEVAELRQGHAIPLVGYVSALPPEQSERTLVSELDEPPNEALLAALGQCLEQFPAVLGYRLEQTFNHERDLEPHPTLTLRTNDASEEDLQALRAKLQEIFEIPLTAPGYIDVVFEDAEPGP
jgi:hypothetical protein